MSMSNDNSIELRYLPPLTKDFILSRITQEDIFEKYLNIKVDISKPHLNPLREDHSPDCWFYYRRDSQGREVLRFNDFAGYFHGDCFDVVAFTIHVNAKTKEGFKSVLDHIAKTFSLHKYSYETEENLIQRYFDIVEQHKKKTTNKLKIEYIERHWHKIDKLYWGAHYLNVAYLNYYNVKPIQELYLNNNHIYTFTPNDPGYCYDFGINDRRVYFPLRKRGVKNNPRFLSNTSIVQNIDNFTPSKFGLITKSYKDVMVLKRVAKDYFDIDSVSPSGETNAISNKDMFILKSNFDYLCTLYDFDYTGIRYTNKLKKLEPVNTFFITNGRFNTIDYKVKDISEFVLKYGIDKTRFALDKLLNEFEKYINTIEHERINCNPRMEYSRMWL